MATADNRKNDCCTEALLSELVVNAAHAMLEDLDRFVILSGLVVSRTQIIVGHNIERAIFPDAGEHECPLAGLDRPLGVARQSVVAIEEVQHPRKSLLIAEILGKEFGLM